MSTKKRGLGKGLSALISDKTDVETLLNENPVDEKVLSVSMDLIRPNANQPRKSFNDSSLKELADSIKKNGIIQPIILRKINDEYEIVAGERRWRASKSLGLEKMPAIIRDIDEETSDKIALIENVQRENLNPIEEAIAYKRLLQEYDLKHEELGQAVGKSRVYISNSIRLLNLDQQVIEYLSQGKITSGHGKVLLELGNKEEQLKAAQKIVDFGLTVKDTAAEIKKAKSKPKVKRKKSREAYIVDIEENLMRSLGTRVNLHTGKNKGKIEIEYYSDEDLERLLDLLTR